MKPIAAAFLLGTTLLHAQTPPATHFVHGQWFNGTQFVSGDFYAERGILTHTPQDAAHAAVVDLGNGFVVPPYGDAHEHNFDSLSRTPAVATTYLHDGIFYAGGMTDVTTGAEEVVAAHQVNTPTTPDVTFAHGGLTGINGHPKEVYDAIPLGFYYPATPEQRAAVVASHAQRGNAYWEISSPADLDAQWPKILAAKPDLIKVYITGSEHFQAPTPANPQLGKGLDPALVPLITAKAHAAGLRVAAHIDTAHDFHVAVTGGVDILAHLPGYGVGPADDLAVYLLAADDIQLAAKRGLLIIPTTSLGSVDYSGPTPEARAAVVARRKALQRENLTHLKAAGIPILVGSDRYGQDALDESNYLQTFGLWSNLEMLRMWAVTTPQAIFPKRRLGELKPGYEASFLVLSANPLLDWKASHAIVDRWKQGTHIEPVLSTTEAAHPRAAGVPTPR